MLAVVLFILKLIGILLLAILGLIGLVLILVLFAPVKYMGKGSKYGESLQVMALITYLNPIVRVKVRYPNEEIVQVKILGFTVFSTKQDTDKEAASDEAGETSTASAEKNNKEEINASQKEKGEHTPENNPEAEQERGYREKGKEISKEQGSPQQSSLDTTKEQQQSKEQESVQAERPEGCEQTTDSESAKEEQTQDASKSSALDTVGYYVSLLQENKGLILKVLKIILNALKTILPRKCYINITFGTGEADKTGFIYAVYCSLNDYLPGKIIFNPVWTEKFAEGEFELKGKIRVIHFAAAAIKIILNKDVRLLYKKIRRV